jgi:hypothetical protein
MLKSSSRLFLCITIMLAFIMTNAFAQPAGREVVTQSIEWLGLTNNVKVSKRLTLILDSQIRFARDFEQMQDQARVALDIKINDHLSIAPLGYVYTWNGRYGKQPATYVNNEHRIWQQVMYKHNLGRLKVDHRVRLEQRFIQVHSRDASNDVIDEGYTNKQNRIRYRFMARLPLNHKALDPKTLFASTYNEVMYSWGKKITFNEPDQNRVFTGLGYQFTPALSLQGGFIYQMLIKSNGTKQENNVGFQVMLNYAMDLTKKKG